MGAIIYREIDEAKYRLFMQRVGLRLTYGNAWEEPDRLRKRRRMAECHDLLIEWVATPSLP